MPIYQYLLPNPKNKSIFLSNAKIDTFHPLPRLKSLFLFLSAEETQKTEKL